MCFGGRVRTGAIEREDVRGRGGEATWRQLRWLRENRCPWDGLTCDAAARGGHLEVLKWARANGCTWHAWTCAEAAKGGHLEVLKWAREARITINKWETCEVAAGGGHLEMLKWAREIGCSWSRRQY